MTQIEMFSTLEEILNRTMAMNGSSNGIHDIALDALFSLPKTLKIYVVTDNDENEKKFTKYGDCLAEWNKHTNWKKMYYFNPQGEITHLKTR